MYILLICFNDSLCGLLVRVLGYRTEMYCFLWGTNWIYICYVEESKPLWSSGQSSWLQNGDVLCFLWGTNWSYVCCVEESRPPLWSSDQSSWLQIQRSGFDSRRYQIFWEVVGLERGPVSLVSKIEELLGRKSSGFSLEIREYNSRDPAKIGTNFAWSVEFSRELRSRSLFLFVCNIYMCVCVCVCTLGKFAFSPKSMHEFVVTMFLLLRCHYLLLNRLANVHTNSNDLIS
jgi:hypothetical protein